MAPNAGPNVTPRPTVFASFKTPLIQSLWDILAGAAGESPASTDSTAVQEAGDATAAGAPAQDLFVLGLPASDNADQRLLRLSVEKDTSGLFFRLEARPKPAEPPPVEIEAISQRLGGIAGLLGILDRELASTKPISGDCLIAFHVAKSQWDCRHLGIPANPVTSGMIESSLASAISIQSIAFDLANGVSGLKKVIINSNDDGKQYDVYCQSSSLLSFAAGDFLAFASDLQALALKGFFSRLENTHA